MALLILAIIWVLSFFASVLICRLGKTRLNMWEYEAIKAWALIPVGNTVFAAAMLVGLLYTIINKSQLKTYYDKLFGE